MRKIRRRAEWLGFVVISAFGLFFLYLKNPAKVEVIPACPFKAVTGYYCPGCKTLRGLHQLVHLNLVDAVHYNMLMVSSLPLLATLLGYDVLNRRLSFRSGFLYAYLCIIMIYWVGRNVPWFPFALWAPSP